MSADLAFCPRIRSEDINAETEASETYEREGYPVDTAADVRAGPACAGGFGAFEDQQDVGVDVSAAGAGSRTCGLAAAAWTGR